VLKRNKFEVTKYKNKLMSAPRYQALLWIKTFMRCTHLSRVVPPPK